MSSSRRRQIVSNLLLALIVLLLVAAFIKSVTEIWDRNDFEVYHFIGQAAAEQRSDIYDLYSPVKHRPFAYPPSAAVLFIPLSWIPFETAGVIFSILKLIVLTLLIWAVVRESGLDPGDRLWRRALMLFTLIIVAQPITNDLSNGQVDLIVATLGLGGIWWMMTGGSRGEWLGGFCMGLAVALKFSPILLLAVPFLHRRWAAMAKSLLWVALLVFALPLAWFGLWVTAGYMDDFRGISSGYYEAARIKRQANLHQMLMFTLGRGRPAEGYRYDAEERRLYKEEDGVRVDENRRMPPVFSERTSKLVWLLDGLLVGLGFLLARRFLWRGRAPPWQWDLAVMAVMLLLLAPVVRRAHLVLLLAPVAWLVCAGFHLIKKNGWRGLLRVYPGLSATALITLVVFQLSDDLTIPVPGVFEVPYHPAVFLTEIGLLGCLFWMAASGVAKSEDEAIKHRVKVGGAA